MGLAEIIEAMFEARVVRVAGKKCKIVGVDEREALVQRKNGETAWVPFSEIDAPEMGGVCEV